MKTKFALMLMAAVGSIVLAVSTPAQQYRIDRDRSRNTSEDSFAPVTVPVPPQPPSPADIRPPGAFSFPRGVFYTGPGGSPEEANLAHQAEQLARQLGEAKSDSDRSKIRTQLGEVLEKQFDQRQKRHEDEIKQLEAQIKKLKDLVDKRQENRREIISARLNQIVKESQGLGW
jgi:hypothetical protein